jgi:branched-chain amino acid transport system substrate-binding protein
MARRITNRRTFLKTAGAVTTVGLAGCSGDGGDGGGDGGDGGGDGGDGGDGGGSTTMAPEGDIVIGNAAPLSGPITPWGVLHRAGLEFAAEQINADGGVGGRNVTVVSQDTQADPSTASTTVSRLVSEDDAVALTGPVLSNVGITVRQVAEEEQVPHIPNLAASANLLTKETRYTFRLAGAATPWLARAIASYIEENGWTKYGAVIADYAYGRSYMEAQEEFITSMDGLESTVELAPPAPGDFTSQLRQMPDDIEFLDIAGHPIGIFDIAQQALELGLQPAAMTGPTIPSGQFYSSLGEDVTAGLMTFPPVDVTASDYREVASSYYDATGEFFDPFVSWGYETVNIVAQAAEDEGAADAESIRNGISAIDYDSILAYPNVSYNEWGELEETKLFGQQFTLEAPEYYPDGDYGFRNVFESEVYGPVDPTNWGS